MGKQPHRVVKNTSSKVTAPGVELVFDSITSENIIILNAFCSRKSFIIFFLRLNIIVEKRENS